VFKGFRALAQFFRRRIGLKPDLILTVSLQLKLEAIYKKVSDYSERIVITAISGGTRNLNGRMLVPMPVVTNISRPLSFT